MSDVQEEQKVQPKMIRYGVFRQCDDVLVRTGICQDIDLQRQKQIGEYAQEGEFKKTRALPVLGAREKRRQSYPIIGEQLGAMADLAKAIRDGTDIDLPNSVIDWLEKIDAVKSAIPKEPN